jgi:hypothetical protein
VEQGLHIYLQEQGYGDGHALSSPDTVEIINSIIRGHDAAILFDGWTEVDESRLYGDAFRATWTARYRRYLISSSRTWRGAYAYNPLAVMHFDHSSIHKLKGTVCEENGIYRFRFNHPDLHEIHAEEPILLGTSSQIPRSRRR